jgi:uncharacterized protein YsxB (DUF464 family)
VIRIQIDVHNHMIAALRSEGHAFTAGSPGDYRIACAAVSQALRSFAELAGTRPDLRADGEAAEPGMFRFVAYAVDGICWYQGVSDLLMTSLRAVQRDYPERVVLEVCEVEGFTAVE